MNKMRSNVSNQEFHAKFTQYYTYDALYRMVEVTGCEQEGLVDVGGKDFQNDLYYSNPPANAMRNYTHHYEYDVLGNI